MRARPNPAPATGAVPALTLRGCAERRGVEYGRGAADRIRDGLAFYGAAFEQAGLARARLKELTAQVASEIDRYDPELLVELDGIARGAEVTLGDVISLNARSELLRLGDEGCTAIACLPSSTADGHTLLAQNWDWHPTRSATGVLLRILPDAGPAMLTFAEAGALARCGLNEHGVGVVGNALECVDGSRPGGVPVALLRRKILGAPSLSEALDVIRAIPRGTSVNHLVASAQGAARACEVTPDDVFDVEPDDALLVHANHFLAPGAQERLTDTGIARTPDTLFRPGRMRRLADDHRPLRAADVQEALRDHEGHPTSICRHLDGPVHARTWTTVASIVMDLDARRLWLAPGPPCEHEYATHDLLPARVIA